MAGTHRGPSSDLTLSDSADLENVLLSQARRFSFFQAFRLLRLQEKKETVSAELHNLEAIRVRPNLSLSFPSADLDRIDLLESEEHKRIFRMTVNFMGLYGASSPLPTFYTEDLLVEKAEDDSVSRDFLDIIHHRLYSLLFKAWMKYRQFFQVAEERDSLYVERLFCLLGLGTPALRNHIGDEKLLRYLGLFLQFPHSATSLRTLLQDTFGSLPVDIVPCVFRRAKIPESQRLKMGAGGHILGRNSFVGEEIDDRMGKFRVQLGPMNQSEFLRFTPGNPDYVRLVGLTELFITEPLAYEIELILAANQAQTACLGDRVRSTLGVTTWVFSEKTLGEVRTRFTVNRN